MSDDRLPPKASVKPKIANFDSATAMLRALASHCRESDFFALGSFPKWSTPFMGLVGALVNHLPEVVRNAVYTWSGWTELLDRAGFRIERADSAAVPIGLAFPRWDGSLAVRALERLSYVAAHVWKRLFAYQFIVRARAGRSQ